MAVIAIDFDHTLVEGDKPIDGAREAVNILREAGHKVLIHSCNNIAWIKRVLENADIRYDGIYGETGLESKKPLADLYIDDRAIQFKGNWDVTLAEALDFVEARDNRKWDA